MKIGKGGPDLKGLHAGSTRKAMKIDRQNWGKMPDVDGFMDRWTQGAGA